MSRLPAVKVLVTRPKQQAVRLAEQLAQAGASPIMVPLLTFRTRTDKNNQILSQQGNRFDWLFFSSINGVEHFHALVSKFSDLENWKHCHIAAVGQKTAEAVERMLDRNADLIPDAYTADRLAEEFSAAYDPASRILLIQGNLSRPALSNGLRQNGYNFEKMVVYDTVEEKSNQELLNKVLHNDKPEVLTFTSPSSIETFHSFICQSEMKKKQLEKLCLVIGPTTEEAAKRYGFDNILLPAHYTAEAMIDALLHYYEQRTGE